eukprot:459785_1
MAEEKATVQNLSKLVITDSMQQSHSIATDKSMQESHSYYDDDEEEDKTNEDVSHPHLQQHLKHHRRTKNLLALGTLKPTQTPLNLDFPIEYNTDVYENKVPSRDHSSSITKRWAEQCQNQQCCAEQDKPFTKENCLPLKRITAVLDVYYKLTNDKPKWDAISTQIRRHKDINDKYGHQELFDDFSHIKLVHIDSDNKKRRRDPKHEPIVRKLCEQFKKDFPCDMKECHAFLNHYRDRGGETELPNTENTEDTAFQQEFYKIHSYFFHSTIQFGTCETCYHEQMEIDKLIKNATKNGSTRFSKSYSIDSDEKEIPSEDDAGAQYSYVGKKQDDAWWKDVKDTPVDVDNRMGKEDRDKIYANLVSQIGVFRWQNPHGFNQRQSQAFLHHKPDFKNIKEEVLGNDYCKLSIDAWNQTLRKSEIFDKSWAGRQIRTKYRSFFEDNIGGHFEKWESGVRITIKEIVTLKLYTDFDKLQFQLKKCFRLETLKDILGEDEDEDENDNHFLKQLALQDEDVRNDLMCRLQQFYHWRGGLLIMLNKFGKRFSDEYIELYHGVNAKMLIKPTISQAFNGPLSTSSSYHVARTFSTAKGMVLKITSHYPKANFCNAFDCGLISDYPEEQEWLIGFMYARVLKVTTRRLGPNVADLNQIWKFVPPSSIAREMFFAIHLFREQIFSMSEHLERILNQFLKVNRYELCDKDVIMMKKYKAQNKDDWGSKSEGCLPSKICSLGARHRKFVAVHEPENDQDAKDFARIKRIIQILWNKFQAFALEPNEGQRIKFDTISQRLKRFFMAKISDKDSEWRVSFKEIMKVFKNAKEIRFMNEYHLDQVVKDRLEKQLKKPVPKRDGIVTAEEFDQLEGDAKKKKFEELQNTNTIEKISFLYYDCDFDKDGIPKALDQKAFPHENIDLNNQDTWSKTTTLWQIRDTVWVVKQTRLETGYTVKIQIQKQ